MLDNDKRKKIGKRGKRKEEERKGKEMLTRQDKEHRAKQRTIPKIQHPARPAGEAKVLRPVQHRIRKHITRRRARHHERAPLPVVILRTERKVNHQHRHRRTGDHHQQVAEKEEAKHVVNLAEPDAVDDKVQLGRDGAKGGHADQQRTRNRSEIVAARLLRRGGDLPRDLVRAHGRTDGGLSEAEPGTGERERQADEEPHPHNDEHGGEWDGAGCATRPHEQVQQEEDPKDKRRQHDGRVDEVLLPLLPVEELVHPRRHVSTDEAEEGVEEYHHRGERAAV